MDTEEYRKKIEEEILKIMEDRLIVQKMDANRAIEMARYILSTLHPHMTLEQIHDVSKNFDKHFSELVPVMLEVQRDYDEKVKEAVTRHVSRLLKENRIAEAHELLKQATSGEVKLKE